MTPIWDLILNCFEDFMLKLIFIASIINMIIGILKDGIKYGWIDGITVLFTVILIVMITVINEYKKERQFEKL